MMPRKKAEPPVVVDPVEAEPSPNTRRRTGLDKPLAAAPEPVKQRPPKGLLGGELTVIQEDAWWSHDMQQEVIRFDTLGRKWHFSPELKNDRAVMRMSISKAGEVKETFVSNAEYGRDGARAMSDALIAEFNEAFHG